MRLRPSNWEEFQHYKDRSPAWIKLHKKLLDNFEYHCLPTASKALAPMLWLLCSEGEDGLITTTMQKIAFRLRTSEKEIENALKPLISNGFFFLEHDASETLAGSEQVASLEKRREEREEARKRAARKCPADFEITPVMQAWAEEKTPGVDLERETEKFKDYTFKAAMTDWEGAWRNWIRRSYERINGGRSSPPQQESFV